MLHTKFRVNRPVGSGKKIFKGFLPYMAAILVMGPASCRQIFHFLVLESFHKKWFRLAK